MTSIIGTVRRVGFAVVAASLFLAGCGSSGSDAVDAVTIVPLELLNSIYKSIKKPVSRALKGWEWESFIDNFGPILSDAKYAIVMRKVTYQSTGADGNLHTMSGLLIMPKAILGSRPSVPILLYQHGTEPYRPYAPSRFLKNLDNPSDYPEVMVAAAIATTGYAVAMADYEGLGDNTDTQPYVHGTTLANQVIDMLRKSRDIIADDSPCKWNSQLFLMGYSEGGYVTMTTTRELEQNHASEFTVTASAPLSGPHDLSGAMRSIILSNSTFKAPYFLPFLLTGYNYAYGNQTPLFSSSFALLTQYNSATPTLYGRFDGTWRSDEINEAMGMDYDTPTLIVPKSVLTPEFLSELAKDNSSLVTYLKDNDSYRGWTNPPKAPMRLYHHRSDDLVPYANSQIAFNAFSSSGAKYHGVKPQTTGVELVEETTKITASSDPAKSIHLSAALPELSKGWKWLDKFKK
jgi:predicted esterase